MAAWKTVVLEQSREEAVVGRQAMRDQRHFGPLVLPVKECGRWAAILKMEEQGLMLVGHHICMDRNRHRLLVHLVEEEVSIGQVLGELQQTVEGVLTL